MVWIGGVAPGRPERGRRASPAQIAAWAEQRPAPRCRPADAELPMWMGLAELVESPDPRVQDFGRGGWAAAEWVCGVTDLVPLMRERWADPNLREIGEATSRAGRAAAGVDPGPGGRRTDLGRIYARGVEEVLFWWSVPLYPRPLWMGGEVGDLGFLVTVIGRVGCDLASAGVRISDARFPYDCVDLMWGISG